MVNIFPCLCSAQFGLRKKKEMMRNDYTPLRSPGGLLEDYVIWPRVSLRPENAHSGLERKQRAKEDPFG